MGLEDYTTEELKAELKRRKQNTKRETPKIIYKELIGIVDKIYTNRKGIWYYEYKLKVFSKETKEPISVNFLYSTFKLKQNYFDKTKLPQIGDKVLLKYRRTKSNHEVFDIAQAKIYKIINDIND